MAPAPLPRAWPLLGATAMAASAVACAAALYLSLGPHPQCARGATQAAVGAVALATSAAACGLHAAAVRALRRERVLARAAGIASSLAGVFYIVAVILWDARVGVLLDAESGGGGRGAAMDGSSTTTSASPSSAADGWPFTSTTSTAAPGSGSGRAEATFCYAPFLTLACAGLASGIGSVAAAVGTCYLRQELGERAALLLQNGAVPVVPDRAKN